jgi:hypothetical protein
MERGSFIDGPWNDTLTRQRLSSAIPKSESPSESAPVLKEGARPKKRKAVKRREQ